MLSNVKTACALMCIDKYINKYNTTQVQPEVHFKCNLKYTFLWICIYNSIVHQAHSQKHLSFLRLQSLVHHQVHCKVHP